MSDDITVFNIDVPEDGEVQADIITALRKGLERAEIHAYVGLLTDDDHSKIQFTFSHYADAKLTSLDQMSETEIGGHLGMGVGEDAHHRMTGFAMISTAVPGQIVRKVRVFPDTVTSKVGGRMEYFAQTNPESFVEDFVPRHFSQVKEKPKHKHKDGEEPDDRDTTIYDMGAWYNVLSMAPPRTSISNAATDEEGRRSASEGGVRSGLGSRRR